VGFPPHKLPVRFGASARYRCRDRLLTTCRRRGPDLIPDFLDADLADFIQQRDDVAMGRHHFGTDRDLDVRICGVQLKKPRQNLIILDKLSIEENRVAG